MGSNKTILHMNLYWKLHRYIPRYHDLWNLFCENLEKYNC